MKRIGFLFFVSLLIFSSCKAPSDRERSEKDHLRIVYTDWSESMALTYLTSILLERDLGFGVSLKMTEVDNVFNEIASAEADIFVDAWLPSTHSEYLALYENRIEVLGINYQPARTGFVVPKYMDIESIGQLNDYYTGPIAGIDTTAGIMRVAREVIEAYGLQNELRVLSEEQMIGELRNAVRRQERIVITGWDPHWMFFRYDLKFLMDPLEIFMQEEQIYSIARTGFADENPVVATFLERMVLTERQMKSLLFEMHLSADPREGVKKWIKENEFVVNQWTRGLTPQRKKIM